MSNEEEYKELANDADLQRRCKELVEATISKAEKIFSNADFAKKTGWKLELESKPLETIIYSIKDTDGKLFALRADLPCSPEVYFKDYWENFPLVEKWNTSMAFSKRAAKMSDNCDITYYGNKDMFAVKARDFVVARGFKRLENGAVLTVGKSITVAEIPEKKEYVRGELVIGAGRFSAKEGDPNVTVVDYLMTIDLKGLLPKMLVNTFMAKMMLNDVECNRKHAAEIAKK